MSEDLIQLPDLEDIKTMLAAAREDVEAEVKEDPELASSTEVLIQVIDIIEEKIGGQKDLTHLNVKQKIDFAAYLSFLQSLLEDLFYFDEDEFEGEDDEEFEEEEDNK